MHCPNCGTVNESANVFCESCGATLSGQPNAQAPVTSASSMADAVDKAANERVRRIHNAQAHLAQTSTENEAARICGKLKVAVIIGIALAVLVAIVLIALLSAARADGVEFPDYYFAGCALAGLCALPFPIGCAAISEWIHQNPAQKMLVLIIAIALGWLTTGAAISLAGIPGTAYLAKKAREAEGLTSAATA